MTYRILNEDDLSDRRQQWPILFAFDDGAPSFIKRALSYAKGEGVLGDDISTVFWNELDEYEQAILKRFDVSCALCEHDYNMSYHEFYNFFELACERYARSHPEEKDVLLNALESYRRNFLQ